MSDTYTEKAVMVTLSVPSGPTDRVTSHWTSCTFGGNTFTSIGSMEVQSVTITAGTESKECVIKGLLPVSEVLIGLRNHVTYPKVNVEVFYVDIDPVTNEASNAVYVYRGIVYQVFPKIFSNYLTIEVKEAKYYTDIVAGISCTEQCYAPYFGDHTICKKTVGAEFFTISDISGCLVTVAEDVTAPDSSFNQGYIELDGAVSKIKYWKSGQVFQTSTPLSSSWVGRSVKFRYGCDQSKESCINIHNNASRFLGTGLGMMDYDPKYSTS